MLVTGIQSLDCFHWLEVDHFLNLDRSRRRRLFWIGALGCESAERLGREVAIAERKVVPAFRTIEFGDGILSRASHHQVGGNFSIGAIFGHAGSVDPLDHQSIFDALHLHEHAEGGRARR